MADRVRDELGETLADADSVRDVEHCLAALAHERGVPVETIADWFDHAPEDVEKWLSDLEDGPATPSDAGMRRRLDE